MVACLEGKYKREIARTRTARLAHAKGTLVARAVLLANVISVWSSDKFECEKRRAPFVVLGRRYRERSKLSSRPPFTSVMACAHSQYGPHWACRPLLSIRHKISFASLLHQLLCSILPWIPSFKYVVQCTLKSLFGDLKCTHDSRYSLEIVLHCSGSRKSVLH